MFELIKNNMIFFDFPYLGFRDLLDLCLVALLFYKTINLVRDTRTWILFKGVLFVLGLAFVSNTLQLHTTWWIISNSLAVGLMVLIVVFQPELRRALEQLGQSGKWLSQMMSLAGTRQSQISLDQINEITRACSYMSAQQTGALIVIEKGLKLTSEPLSGIPINGTLTAQLLINIFEKNTPLHDGAVLIRQGDILSAACILPLTESLSINKSLGTRHRAALGISERSDAVVVVVSEETGVISYVENGMIKRNLSEFDLKKQLKKALCYEEVKRHARTFKKGGF